MPNRRAADTRGGATANLGANIGLGANHGAPANAGPSSRHPIDRISSRHHIANVLGSGKVKKRSGKKTSGR